MKKFILFILLVSCLELFCQPLVYIVNRSGHLYTINLNTCGLRHIGATGVPDFADLATTPDGRLWGIQQHMGYGVVLYKIDTASAVSVSVGVVKQYNPMSLFSYATSLVALNDSILLMSENSGLRLVSFKVSNGAATIVGPIGYISAGDLTWYDNALYLMSDKLRKITLNSSNTAITNVSAVGNDTIPKCYGAVTYSAPGSKNFIVGIAPGKAYKICQVDGTYSTLCPLITTIGTYTEIAGAAFARLPIQQPEPTTCLATTTGVEHPTAQNKKIQVSPNPVNRNESLFIKLNYDSGDPFSIQLLNLQGKVIFSGTGMPGVGDFEVELKTLELSTGVYLIRATSATSQFRSLVLIE